MKDLVTEQETLRDKAAERDEQLHSMTKKWDDHRKHCAKDLTSHKIELVKDSGVWVYPEVVETVRKLTQVLNLILVPVFYYKIAFIFFKLIALEQTQWQEIYSECSLRHKSSINIAYMANLA